MDTKQLLLYESVRFFIGPLIAARFRMKVEGRGNVPDTGAAIIVCNHRSALDPVLLAYSVPNRYISFGAAAWSWDVPLYRQIHEKLGAFPLTLTGGKNADKELSRAVELLNEGEIVGMFPEGGDTILDPGRVDKINRFRTGFAKLALQTRVPVIPAAIVGSGERRLPKIPGPVAERFIQHPQSKKGYSAVTYKRARCRIGVPLDFGDLYDKPVDRKLLELITTKVRDIIMKLYNGEGLDRFLTGEVPFDFAYERIGGREKKLL